MMRTHVPKTVSSSCFAVLRQLRSIRRSVSDRVLQSLVVALVLTKLDYGSATLAWVLPAVQLDRLQSVLNAAERLIYRFFRRRKFDHVSPLLKKLHWLQVPERITFRLAVLAYRCQHNIAPRYLTSQLHQASNVGYGQRLRSSSSAMLDVPRTKHVTIGGRAFIQLQLVCGIACQRQCNLLSRWTFFNAAWKLNCSTFLQLTPRLSNDFTAARLTFTFPQLIAAVAATLKSIDYNVAMTFILNNNNNNNNNCFWQGFVCITCWCKENFIMLTHNSQRL